MWRLYHLYLLYLLFLCLTVWAVTTKIPVSVRRNKKQKTKTPSARDHQVLADHHTRGPQGNVGGQCTVHPSKESRSEVGRVGGGGSFLPYFKLVVFWMGQIQIWSRSSGRPTRPLIKKYIPRLPSKHHSTVSHMKRIAATSPTSNQRKRLRFTSDLPTSNQHEQNTQNEQYNDSVLQIESELVRHLIEPGSATNPRIKATNSLFYFFLFSFHR